MKATFFHDAPLIKGRDGQIYSEGFSYNIWERYLAVFDSIIISTRMKLDDSADGFIINDMKLSSGPNVEFKPITSYRGKTDAIINKRKIENEVKQSLQQSDCAIIRLPSFIGSIAHNEVKKMNKPYLVEVVGCAWDALWNYSSIGKLVAIPSYFNMKNTVKNAQYVTYVTNEFLQKRYPTIGKNVHCSNVALTEFSNEVLNRRTEKIREYEKESKIIIGTTAAVNVRYKGQHYVIEALGKLKKRGITNFEYQLVGAGDQSYLKSVAEKHDVVELVNFLGPMQHNKVFDWLEEIDLYVQPSRQEGLPRALIEAMSRGLPAFGAKTAGIPELLKGEFLFSNTKHNIDEICDILTEFTKEKMELQAKKNFEESRKYDKIIIETRRKEFFLKFKQSIIEGQEE